jgi:hypothetical protein
MGGSKPEKTGDGLELIMVGLRVRVRARVRVIEG